MIPATYAWPGGTETMLRFGPATGPVVIAALPLFEEANRTRTFVVTILRALAERGIAGILPDLPGTGDSMVPTSSATILHMRQAYEAVAALVELERRPAFAFGIRSAALLDTLALLHGRYHLAPQPGEQLVRELKRIRYSDPSERTPEGDTWIGASDTIEIAGNSIAPHTLYELSGASYFGPEMHPTTRVARLETDPQPADVKFAAAPLWRRPEPDNDSALAASIADDIAAWIATCVD